MVNFTAADRVGAIGGYIGGISTLLGGNLGGILGGGNNCGCSDNMPINRFESELQAKNSKLETEVMLRDAYINTDEKLGKLRDYVDSRMSGVENQLCEQRVYNATLNGAVGCIQSQVAALQAITRTIIPNSSICPGWGEVNVSIPTTTTTAGA